MPKISVYNQEGNISGEIELDDSVFGIKFLDALIHQVYVALRSNARQPWAHSKDKGEVAGGGRKPWKQKGTGRARHGSIRSPIWKGGGVTFGPLNTRNYKQKINKKMNKKAVKMVLSEKVREGKFFVIDSIENKEGKTKVLANLRKALPGLGKTTLLLTHETDANLKRSIKNIQKFDIQRAVDVNLTDLMHNQYIITTKESINVLEKRLK